MYGWCIAVSELANPIFKQVIVEVPGAPAQELPPASPELAPATRPPVAAQRPKPNRWFPRWALGVIAVAVLAAGAAIWRAKQTQRSGTTTAASAGPRTAVVQRRDFVHTLRLTGTIQAIQSYMIAAPRLSGQQIGQLTVTKLTPSGTKVKKGDLLVEFDRQDQITNSMDRKADYLGFRRSDRQEARRPGRRAGQRRDRLENRRRRSGNRQIGDAQERSHLAH